MHTKERGDMTEAKVLVKLMELGYVVSEPRTEVARYDFIIDDGELYRIQVKTGNVKDGYVVFNTCDTRSNRTGSTKRYYTKDDIDAFVVYAPDIETFYWVDIEDAPNTAMRLRFDKSAHKNSRINWAKDYQI